MKKGFLIVLIISAVTGNAQSLKDALYSGKLKMDSNTVIKKGDDISAKIDTSTRKPEAERPKLASVDSSSKAPGTLIDSAVGGVAASDSATTPGAIATTTEPAAKTNTQVWKEYMDSLASTLNTDVLSSKKINKGTYYLYVDYEIGIDGQVSITNVVSSPENSFLQDQVKERMLLSAPPLTPVLDSSNKPRKVKRKYNFNITKG